MKQSKSSDLINEIIIGDQIWMTKNLVATHFKNGDHIPEAKSEEEWVKYCNEKSPTWCYFSYDQSNLEKFGIYYNLYAIIDKRGLAPNNWHIPSKHEWMKLIEFLGGEEIAGKKMKSVSGWENSSEMKKDKHGKMTWIKKDGNGDNSAGLSLQPIGKCYDEGMTGWANLSGFYWSYPQNEENQHIVLHLSNTSDDVFWSPNNPDDGFQVRCLKSNNDEKISDTSIHIDNNNQEITDRSNIDENTTYNAKGPMPVSSENKSKNIFSENKNIYYVHFEISSDYEDQDENIKKEIIAEFEAKSIDELKNKIESEIESFEWDDSEIINHEAKSELICTNKEFLFAKNHLGKVILKEL